LKPELAANIEKGMRLTMAEVERAENQRVELAARMLAFLDRFDLLLCPATIVAPFPIGQRYVTECNGVKFDNYVTWLAIAYAITLTCSPALSLPCGFTREGLPVGIQIVAPPRAEARLLAAAKALEDILGLRGSTPIEPKPPATSP
jgi:amidase